MLRIPETRANHRVGHSGFFFLQSVISLALVMSANAVLTLMEAENKVPVSYTTCIELRIKGPSEHTVSATRFVQ